MLYKVNNVSNTMSDCYWSLTPEQQVRKDNDLLIKVLSAKGREQLKITTTPK